ncbi:hypothetical protein DSO57_1037015 [Entomophthora muscae]|uniref:Uncharacterized protein n=1 Tax=Entomophthora muscae TaxID=34485 RepID=A0ACC2S190_9FUNG|nr:hypothetical protein DSO57_1037015 [Entomophthora muscae]
MITPKKETTQLEDQTSEYDSMTCLSYVAYPLSGRLCHPIPVMYEEHKGWYSNLINTAVGFVLHFWLHYVTPQLFISNYKLKSVAHMTWKTFMCQQKPSTHLLMISFHLSSKCQPP